MESRSYLKQRTRLMLRSFTPSRLRDELLATVYDRLLAAGSLSRNAESFSQFFPRHRHDQT